MADFGKQAPEIWRRSNFLQPHASVIPDSGDAFVCVALQIVKNDPHPFITADLCLAPKDSWRWQINHRHDKWMVFNGDSARFKPLGCFDFDASMSRLFLGVSPSHAAMNASVSQHFAESQLLKFLDNIGAASA